MNKALLFLTLLGLALPAWSTDALPVATVQEFQAVDARGLGAFAERVRQHEPVIIGFLGGSITLGSGASVSGKCYRELTGKALIQEIQSRGGRAKTVHAAIGGTTSTFGAYRVEAQLLVKKPDLLVVEFAVNDQAAPTLEGMEGIVRQALAQNPKMGIVFLYTANAQGVKDAYDQGRITDAVAAHHRVARHYGIMEVLAGPVVSAGVKAGTYTLAEFLPDGTHPSDLGHACYAQLLTKALVAALDQPVPGGSPTLPPLLGTGRLARARLTPPVAESDSDAAWTVKPDQWNWYGVPILVSSQAGKTLHIRPPEGEDLALIFLGTLRLQWRTKTGVDMERTITGKFGLPFPATQTFPVGDIPDATGLRIEALPGDKSVVNGQVWGFRSVQPLGRD